MEEREHTRVHIERAIGRARDGVGERIDEIEQLIRGKLDWRKRASEHAPEIAAAGAVVGFLLGAGGSKALTRAVQLAVPVAVIIKLVRSQTSRR